MKTVILLISPENNPEIWTGFKKMCLAKEWSYNYLKRIKPPFMYKGWEIYKLELQ